MQTNVFLGGNADPLLGNYNNSSVDYDRQLAELKEMQERLEAKRRQIAETNPRQGKSPIWDEIEKLTGELSDLEFDTISHNEDFQQSQQAIMAILQREQMRMMRPIVENTADGKAALESHLNLIKQLRKDAARETNRNLELFNEYTQYHSDMTYSDFLKMKKGKTNPKPKK